MISLIYVSSAVNKFSKPELLALLEQSRLKNFDLDITGMLLYRDGNFIQVLEGPPDAVRQLFETIKADPRHHGVLRLMERPIQQRQFSDWSMGFKDLDEPSLDELPGYNEFMNLPLDSEAYRSNPGFAHKLIELFRRNMR